MYKIKLKKQNRTRKEIIKFDKIYNIANVILGSSLLSSYLQKTEMRVISFANIYRLKAW